MKKVTLTIMLALLAATGAWAQGTRYYVNVNGGDDGNTGIGSWENAFETLQKAIDAASSDKVDTIFVAKGEYGQTSQYILDSKDIKIYGSFKGTEASLAERVIGTNVGDATVLNAKRACRVFYLENRTNATVIDGLIITGGYAVASGSYYGDGMYNDNSSPILTNLTISRNYESLHGGGMYNINNSSPFLFNVTISGNSSSEGGGMYNENSCPILVNVSITGNRAVGAGGGMINDNSSSILINTTISGNTVGSGAGGMANYDSSPRLYNSIVLGNRSNYGWPDVSNGGYVSGSNPTYYNCLVYGLSDNTNYNIDGTSVDVVDVFVSPIDRTINVADPSTGGDYRLKPGSVAINNGNNDYWNTDKLISPYYPTLLKTLGYTSFEQVRDVGDQVRFNHAVDIGAYESPLFFNTRVYVKTFNNGGNDDTGDGFSWGTAFATLRKALTVADEGDSIFVAKGEYTQSLEYSLFYKNIKIYGSFKGDGTESTLDDRVIGTNVGDTTILNANSECRVFYLKDRTNATVIDGLIITGGNAVSGGGMYNETSSPMLTNVTISGNTASNVGGGMFNNNSSPILTNVTISGHWATNGGGMHNDISSPVLTNVTISGNTASTFGGGVSNWYYSSLVLTNVTISGNSASEGGGMYNYDNSSPVLTNVTINGNTSNSGGGMFNESNSSPVLTNVTISGNSASSNGGGMLNWTSSSPELYNSIVLGNQAPTNAGEYGGSPNNYFHSLVQGLDLSGANNNLDGTNIEATDVFVSPKAPGLSIDGNYRLKFGSPAIDKGDNSYNNVVALDLDGNTRIVNGIIDLGAYESAIFPAVITTHPQGSVVCHGFDRQITVGATGTNLNFQWYKDNTIIPGATKDEYTITNAQLADAGSYTVSVTADVGSTVTSNAAEITVGNPTVIVTDLPENITFSSSPATLRVEVTGDDLNY